ncbi:hypothetical protein BOTBODRAFT_65285 [Botryobasidium botryosum FD-172 SS1]|uniref:Uncharacterized protein n=1 Tax=Botryobasidium botryosum (strain FD-172 SS1) TaxID=930990 RepID=A0A067MJ54_BOTB1|nr:hypothetical protein BOTBODRAFT_65285 [Botryobasidium botryosum FD-172 SS1]
MPRRVAVGVASGHCAGADRLRALSCGTARWGGGTAQKCSALTSTSLVSRGRACGYINRCVHKDETHHHLHYSSLNKFKNHAHNDSLILRHRSRRPRRPLGRVQRRCH